MDRCVSQPFWKSVRQRFDSLSVERKQALEVEAKANASKRRKGTRTESARGQAIADSTAPPSVSISDSISVAGSDPLPGLSLSTFHPEQTCGLCGTCASAHPPLRADLAVVLKANNEESFEAKYGKAISEFPPSETRYSSIRDIYKGCGGLKAMARQFDRSVCGIARNLGGVPDTVPRRTHCEPVCKTSQLSQKEFANGVCKFFCQQVKSMGPLKIPRLRPYFRLVYPYR